MKNKEGEKEEIIKIRDKGSKRNLKHNKINTHQKSNLEIEMIIILNQMNINQNNKIERRKKRRRIKIKIEKEKEIDQVQMIIKTKRRKRKERNKENRDNKDNKIHQKMIKKDLNQKKVRIHLMTMNNSPINHKNKEEKDKNPKRKIQREIKMMMIISISMIISSSDQN